MDCERSLSAPIAVSVFPGRSILPNFSLPTAAGYIEICTTQHLPSDIVKPITLAQSSVVSSDQTVPALNFATRRFDLDLSLSYLKKQPRPFATEQSPHGFKFIALKKSRACIHPKFAKGNVLVEDGHGEAGIFAEKDTPSFHVSELKHL